MRLVFGARSRELCPNEPPPLLLLFGVCDCAQAEAAEGFVLRFPSLGRGLALELAAGALVDLHLLKYMEATFFKIYIAFVRTTHCDMRRIMVEYLSANGELLW